MRKSIKILAVLLASVLLSQGCSVRKYSQVRCSSVAVQSFVPTGAKSFDAVLDLELVNPAPSLKVKDFHAVVKRAGKALLELDAAPLTLEGNSTKVYGLPVQGTLPEGTGLMQILTILRSFDPDKYTVDVSAKAVKGCLFGKKVEFKDVPLNKILKK